MPPCPIAMPSSTAIVLNSRGMAPAARIASATTWPTSRRCTCPGTNSVKLLATATMGLPMSSRATPVARSSARAPAMLRPCVTVRDLIAGMTPPGAGYSQAFEAFSVPVPSRPPLPPAQARRIRAARNAGPQRGQLSGMEDLVQLGQKGGFGERLLDQLNTGFEDALRAEEALCVAGHEHHPGGGLEETDLVRKFLSLHLRHDHVGEQHVDVLQFAGEDV